MMGKASLAIVLMVATGAYADLHIVQQFSNNYSDTPQNANASLTASGSATVSGSGTYYSWVGWPVSSWASVTISFNNQTVGLGLDPDTINATRDPDGSGLVSFETVVDTLKQGTLDDVVVDLDGGVAVGLALDNIVLSGEISGLGIPVTVTLSTSGALNDLDFDMTSGPTGSYASGAFPSITYNVSPSGTVTANWGATITGVLDISGILTIDLGTLGTLGGTESIGGVGAAGTMTLTELAGPYAKDVAVALHSDVDAVGLTLGTSGSTSVNTYAGNKNPYYTVNFNYSMTGSMSVDASVDLYDTIIDAIPDPATLSIFGLGSGLFVLARRRR